MKRQNLKVTAGDLLYGLTVAKPEIDQESPAQKLGYRTNQIVNWGITGIELAGLSAIGTGIAVSATEFAATTSRLLTDAAVSYGTWGMTAGT